MNNRWYKTIIFMVLAVAFVVVHPLSVLFAGETEDSTVISTKVKINICGNEIVENPVEDCEGLDLNGHSCTTLGYESGELSCDIACTFDLTLCIPFPPPPEPDPGEGSGPDGSTPTPPFSPLRPAPTSLPPGLELFDLRGVGRVLKSDLPMVVHIWVDSWAYYLRTSNSGKIPQVEHLACDVNNDDICDLVDFSVLMFYIDR